MHRMCLFTTRHILVGQLRAWVTNVEPWVTQFVVHPRTSHNGFPMDGHWVHIIASRDGWFKNNAVKENNCYSRIVNCI